MALEEYAEALARERFIYDMIRNLVANMRMIVALAAARQMPCACGCVPSP